jgi:flagellar biosynthesis/type III secretory pathway chaperone
VASLVEELVKVLETEQKLYQVLIDFAKEKTQILIRGDVPALERLTDQEQLTSDKLNSQGNKQKQLLNDIAVVLGKTSEPMTVTRLIGLLDTQPKVQTQLINARDRLIETAKQMKSLNNQNIVLIQQAIELSEFDLTLFKSMRQAPETANYDRRACNTGTLLGSSAFDTTS